MNGLAWRKDEWTRTHFRRWDAYFAVVAVATTVFVLTSSDAGWDTRVAAAAMFSATVPWYVWVGRPALLSWGDSTRRSALYTVVMLLLFLPPAVLVGEIRVATFALAPQCFMLLRLRWALPAVTVLNVLPVTGWALAFRPALSDLLPVMLFAIVTLAFSVIFGTWVIHIVEQSAERARLIAELAESRDEVARLSVERGALAERERMSREIHDTLAQGFTSLLMLVQAAEADLESDPARVRDRLALMTATARENLAEARALVAGGAPAGLGGGSLVDAVRRLTARHGAQTGAAAGVEVHGTPRPLPPAVEVVALRACQEALANVRQHAGPNAPVAVVLAYGPERLRLTIRDQGRGLPADTDTDRARRGYGLAGIRARAAEIGGVARIGAVPGGGTEVSLRLPLLPPGTGTPVACPEPADTVDDPVGPVGPDALRGRFPAAEPNARSEP